MSVDFLSESNLCGQTVLKLVSRGNAIIAELLRLGDFIPPLFRLDNRLDQERYKFIIPDFHYFECPEFYEGKIDANSELQDRDEDFRENHVDIVTRFYKAFESIHKYVVDLNRFLDDLEEGVYIQQTLENVLLDKDGKQVLSEALFVYGVMLLVVDMKMEGPVRERLLVAFHRSSSQQTNVDSNIDDVCKLLRSTGYSRTPVVRRPAKYPEDFFSRVPISQNYIDMVIGRLRSDDIYSTIATYPNPEHRSTALATQAAMLYVILFFSPSILHSQQAQMREIVDKHFPDNWVISLYMGMTVNLLEMWEPYKAARTALANTLQPGNIQEQAMKFSRKIPTLNKQVEGYLKEGTLVEDFVLDNVSKLMGCIRDCNSTLRWVMLHNALVSDHHKRCKQIREEVASVGYNAQQYFIFLLNTAQLEYLLRQMFQKLLDEKQSKWENYKKEGSERMSELGEVFSGTKPLTRVEKNEHLQAWFTEMANQISSLSYDDATIAGRKITQIIAALEEVQEFHQLEANMQVKQFLEDTKRFLIQMLRTINIKDESLNQLEVIGDLSYAWILVDTYTPFMQAFIKRKPALVIKLRATFLKLASALQLPCQRIFEAKSRDFESVSAYYSRELDNYIRKVLQIIPESMFNVLHQIINLLTHRMREIPTRLDKDKMKDFAQMDERYQVAKLTYDISVFTEGILLMKTTKIGTKIVDSKQLLEDGIRKELVKQVAAALHGGLVFNPKAKVNELAPRLRALAEQMNGFKRSFEYIQDYVNIYGLKIWQEEVSRIINYNVEQECNSFLRTKVLDFQSLYQSRTIPIPVFPPVDGSAVTFVGRLANELLRMTDTRSTSFIEQMSAWYDKKTMAEVLNLKIWEQLKDAVDIFGLSALDRLFCFMIVRELQYFLKYLKRLTHQSQPFFKQLRAFMETMGRPENLIGNAGKVYAQTMQQFSKVWGPYLDCILRVGQIQLIRRQIAHELNRSCKFDSKLVCNSLQTLNSSLLTSVEAHYRDPDNTPYPGGEQETVFDELTPYLETAGINDPLTKIYATTRLVQGFGAVHFLFVISQLPKLMYNKGVGSMVCRKPTDPLDGPALVAGCITILRQFHSDNREMFLGYMGQYVRSMVENQSSSKDKSGDLSQDVVTSLYFLEQFSHYAGLPRKTIERYIPSYIFDEFKHTSS